MAVFTREHTARKRRRCQHCRQWIIPGQQYVLTVFTPKDPDIGNEKWLRIAEHRPQDCDFLPGGNPQ